MARRTYSRKHKGKQKKKRKRKRIRSKKRRRFGRSDSLVVYDEDAVIENSKAIADRMGKLDRVTPDTVNLVFDDEGKAFAAEIEDLTNETPAQYYGPGLVKDQDYIVTKDFYSFVGTLQLYLPLNNPSISYTDYQTDIDQRLYDNYETLHQLPPTLQTGLEKFFPDLYIKYFCSNLKRPFLFHKNQIVNAQLNLTGNSPMVYTCVILRSEHSCENGMSMNKYVIKPIYKQVRKYIRGIIGSAKLRVKETELSPFYQTN